MKCKEICKYVLALAIIICITIVMGKTIIIAKSQTNLIYPKTSEQEYLLTEGRVIISNIKVNDRLIICDKDNNNLQVGVIGVPDDEIKILDGDVIVNNKLKAKTEEMENQDFILANDEYYVYSQNVDSGNIVSKKITKEEIKGKVLKRFIQAKK